MAAAAWGNRRIAARVFPQRRTVCGAAIRTGIPMHYMRFFPGVLLALLAACGDRHEGPDFDDPLHAHGIRLPPPELGMPPDAPPETAQVFPVPPPPFTPGIFPCSRCHLGGEPVKDDRPAIPHLKHIERDINCEDCHGKDPKIPAVDTCFDCHEKDMKGESEAVQAYFKSIREGDNYVFPRRFATKDLIPNHPGHLKAGLKCADCHGETANTPFEKPRAVPWMKRCIACHEDRKAPTSCKTCHKEIREPKHKNIVLHHAENQRGCLDCHDPDNRDVLRLANGQPVSFAESYLLCGQCHGTKLRDWKEGLHGKRTGMWDGDREYFLCVHCHRNPHAPHFPPMEPVPPPLRPEDIK